jgi:hypothetical protein
MKKTVVIHQPDFLPHLGFFHKLLHADKLVILDDVQFLRRGWSHRDKIKTRNGEVWLTVGLKKSPQNSKINEMQLNNEDWKDKHLNLIRQNYKQAIYFQEIYPYIENLYSGIYDSLISFNLASINMLMNMFSIKIDLSYSSHFFLKSKSNQLLVDILCNEDATHYLSGIGAKDYYEKEPFSKAGIEVIWQDFRHPTYPQLFGEFTPYLSSIDLLFNCGIMQSKLILRGC